MEWHLKGESKINGEYTAQKVDGKWNGAPARPRGPFESALRGYGDGGDHCIRGHAVGMFGGISKGFTETILYTAAASTWM